MLFVKKVNLLFLEFINGYRKFKILYDGFDF